VNSDIVSTVSLADLLALQVQCANCETTISFPLEDWYPKGFECPKCQKEIWSRESAVNGAAERLGLDLRNLAKASEGPRRRLER